MTPQEKKARELVSKNFEVIAKASGYKGLKKEGERKFYAIEKVAKECALITVSEILNMQLDDPSALDKEYWYEVKQELEKL